MDNYGMRKNANKWDGKEEEIEMVDHLYHSGFTFQAIVETIAEDFEMSEDDANVLVSEIMQAAW